jgi:hypothetical protein
VRGEEDEVEERGKVGKPKPLTTKDTKERKGRSGDLVIARDRVIGQAKAYRGFTRMSADQEIGKTFNHKGHEGTQRKIENRKNRLPQMTQRNAEGNRKNLLPQRARRNTKVDRESGTSGNRQSWKSFTTEAAEEHRGKSEDI